MGGFKNIYSAQRLKEYLDDICRKNYIGSKRSSFRGFDFELFNDSYKGKKWEIFKIPKDKKKNTYRIICAPTQKTKMLLVCIKNLLEEVYVPNVHATAYCKSQGIKVNAGMHIGQNWVYNIDLKDFFFHITHEMIERRLTQSPFYFKRHIANIIASVCCMHDNTKLKEKWGAFLPQGSPVSPLLSNAICDKMDIALQKIARIYGCHYSRYADDITFSGGDNISKNVNFIRDLNFVIKNCGFTINDEKTRCQHYSQRQVVTGLTVNEKVNISSKYCKEIRSILHIWEKYGYEAAVKTYLKYHPNENKYIFEKKINGKIAYICQIKGNHNPLYLQLSSRFEKLVR